MSKNNIRETKRKTTSRAFFVGNIDQFTLSARMKIREKCRALCLNRCTITKYSFGRELRRNNKEDKKKKKQPKKQGKHDKASLVFLILQIGAISETSITGELHWDWLRQNPSNTGTQTGLAIDYVLAGYRELHFPQKIPEIGTKLMEDIFGMACTSDRNVWVLKCHLQTRQPVATYSNYVYDYTRLRQ